MPPAYPNSVYSFGNWEMYGTVDPLAEVVGSTTSTTTSKPILTTTYAPSSTSIPSTTFSSTSTSMPTSTFVPTFTDGVQSELFDGHRLQVSEIEWVGGGIGAFVASMIIWLLCRWFKGRGNSGTFKVEPVLERSPVRLIELEEMSTLFPPPPPPLPTVHTPVALDRPIVPVTTEECARDTLMREIREVYKKKHIDPLHE